MMENSNKKPVSSVIDFLTNIKFQEAPGSEHKVFYRGSNYRYQETLSVPGVYRDPNHATNELKMIDELISRLPEKFSSCQSAIEKLVMLQHYELPTRLLDITSNPLVALYFACLENKEDDQDKEGVVIRYKVPDKHIKYTDSDTVSVLANISFIDNDTKKNLKNKNEMAKFIHQIKTEKPYFKSEIHKEHLNKYVACVLPKLNNERIKAQQGAFLLFGIDSEDHLKCVDFVKKINPHIEVTEYKINKNKRKNILNELDMLGINQSVLFPELDRVAKYVKEKYQTAYVKEKYQTASV